MSTVGTALRAEGAIAEAITATCAEGMVFGSGNTKVLEKGLSNLAAMAKTGQLDIKSVNLDDLASEYPIAGPLADAEARQRKQKPTAPTVGVTNAAKLNM